MTELTGRCLCGALRYRMSGEIVRTGHCHCESCRRATSSPLTTFLVALAKDVSFSGDTLRHFASSRGVKRGFCVACGSSMTFETSERPDEIDLYVASLDDASGVEIEQHWYWNERVSWLHCEDDLPKRED